MQEKGDTEGGEENIETENALSRERSLSLFHFPLLILFLLSFFAIFNCWHVYCYIQQFVLHFSGFFWKLDVCRRPISNQTSCLGHCFAPFFENGPLPSRETFKPRPDVSSTETSELRSEIELKSDLNMRRRPISTKSGKMGGEGAGYNPWELWSDPCAARLAPGLKPLRLPRAPRRTRIMSLLTHTHMHT